MPKVTLDKPKKEQPVEHPPTKNLSEAVTKNVLNRLGKPQNLTKIVANPVGDQRFRVNIWCAVNPEIIVHSDITDSFYVVVNEDGGIIRSSPDIVRKY